MSKIFVSYRREDSQDIAGRIDDRLAAHFGRDSVFFDINIPIGVDFREHLVEAVGQCDVLLAVIGKQWLDMCYRDGPRADERRLDDPDDFVRIEVQLALTRSIPVVPVLVAGARMPTEQELPVTLRNLAYRNATEVRSGRDFHDLVGRLIRGIEDLLSRLNRSERPRTTEEIIGIDLGTTNSVVAVMGGNTVTVIPNQEGNRLTPSVVAFTDKGDPLVGDPAKRQAVTNPRRTIYSIKRIMGRRRKEVLDEEKLLPYRIVGEPEDPAKVEIDGKTYASSEISAMILRKIKESAEAFLGHRVSKAVITVPAYFNDAKRQATLAAAAMAGFDTEWEIEDPGTGKKSRQRMRIISEPTAASLAYGLEKRKNEHIAVFNLGGGTFDISILDVGDGVFQVMSTNGDTHLGGDDFDQVLIDYLADEFKKEKGIDLRKDPMVLQWLKEAAERAKKDLSQQETTDVNLPFITAGAPGPKHLM